MSSHARELTDESSWESCASGGFCLSVRVVGGGRAGKGAFGPVVTVCALSVRTHCVRLWLNLLERCAHRGLLAMVKWGTSFQHIQDKAEFEKRLHSLRGAVQLETWRWLGREAEQPSRAAFQRPSSAAAAVSNSKRRAAIRLRAVRAAPRVMPSLPKEILKRADDARFVRALYDYQEDEVIRSRQQAAVERAADELRRKNLRLALTARFQLRDLTRGWRGWLRQWREAERFDEGVQTTLGRMHHRQRLIGWTAWAQHTAKARHILFATKHMRSYLRGRNLARGWRPWYRRLERAVRRRNAMRRMIHHMMNRKLSLGWNVWMAKVASVRNAKQVVRRVLGFFMYSSMKRGWLQWHGTYVEAVRKLDLIRNVARLLAKRDKARGWRGWHGVWLDRKAKTETMRKSLGKMTKRGLARGWEAWLSFLDILEQQALERELMTKMLKQMTQRKLSMGWNGWRSTYLQAKNDLDVMRASLTRLRQRELSRSWECWQEKTEAARANLNAIDQSLRYLQNQTLLSGWLPWVQMAAEWRAAEEISCMGLDYGILHSKKAGLDRWVRFRREMLLARELAAPSVGMDESGMEKINRYFGEEVVPLPRQDEFVEFLAKTVAEAKRLRARNDALPALAEDSEPRVVDLRPRVIAFGRHSPPPSPLKQRTQRDDGDETLRTALALRRLGLAALPQTVSALDAEVRSQLLLTKRDRGLGSTIAKQMTREILAARYLLKARIQGDSNWAALTYRLQP